MKTSISRTIEVTPDPEELGRCFSEMNSDDQARFFTQVAVCMEADDYNRPMQLHYLAGDLRRRARVFNDEMAEQACEIVHELSLDLREWQPAQGEPTDGE